MFYLIDLTKIANQEIFDHTKSINLIVPEDCHYKILCCQGLSFSFLFLSHGGLVIFGWLLRDIFILGRDVGGDSSLDVGGRGCGGQPHDNEGQLDVSPGGHNAEDQQQQEDLGQVEGAVENITDEGHDEDQLVAHEDDQPGQQQHPLVSCHANAGQAVTHERDSKECEKTVSVKVGKAGEELQVPSAVLLHDNHVGGQPDHLHHGAHQEEHVEAE